MCHMCARNISAAKKKILFKLGQKASVGNRIAVILREILLRARVMHLQNFSSKIKLTLVITAEENYCTLEHFYIDSSPSR